MTKTSWYVFPSPGHVNNIFRKCDLEALKQKGSFILNRWQSPVKCGLLFSWTVLCINAPILGNSFFPARIHVNAFAAFWESSAAAACPAFSRLACLIVDLRFDNWNDLRKPLHGELTLLDRFVDGNCYSAGRRSSNQKKQESVSCGTQEPGPCFFVDPSSDCFGRKRACGIWA